MSFFTPYADRLLPIIESITLRAQRIVPFSAHKFHMQSPSSRVQAFKKAQGTTVITDFAAMIGDCGCTMSEQVFEVQARQHKLKVTKPQIKQFMGLDKKDHLMRLLELPAVLQQLPTSTSIIEILHRLYTEKYKKNSIIDVVSQVKLQDPIQFPKEHEKFGVLFNLLKTDLYDKLYGDFTTIFIELLKKPESTLFIEAVYPLLQELRANKVKVGLTSDDDGAMMRIVEQVLKRQDVELDALVSSSDVLKPRPHPDLYLEAARRLKARSETCIVVGDTPASIRAGVNAGMVTIGAWRTSNIVGLDAVELAKLSPTELDDYEKQATLKLKEAGADFVVPSFAEIKGPLLQLDDSLIFPEIGASLKKPKPCGL